MLVASLEGPKTVPLHHRDAFPCSKAPIASDARGTNATRRPTTNHALATIEAVLIGRIWGLISSASASQHPREQESGSAPAADPPEAFTPGLGRDQSFGQGIQQSLGHGKVLAAAALAGAPAASSRSQAVESTEMVKQPRTLGPEGDPPEIGPSWRGTSERRAHGARMDQAQANRPVHQPSQPFQPAAPSSGSPPVAVASGRVDSWPDDSRELAEQLQRRLVISDRDWHALKAQRSRRAAEQLAGALVQLLGADDPAATRVGEARERAIALTTSALAWLKGELRDPGCPDHGR